MAELADASHGRRALRICLRLLAAPDRAFPILDGWSSAVRRRRALLRRGRPGGSSLRGNLFFCDWGRGGVIRYQVTRTRGTYRVEGQEYIVRRGVLGDFGRFRWPWGSRALPLPGRLGMQRLPRRRKEVRPPIPADESRWRPRGSAIRRRRGLHCIARSSGTFGPHGRETGFGGDGHAAEGVLMARLGRDDAGPGRLHAL